MSMSESRITAFPDGNSFVSFDGLKSKLIVGNSGGLIKIFKHNEPDLEPISIDIFENLTNLHIGNTKVLVSTTSGKLECVDLLKKESIGDLFRSELPLRDAVFINEEKRVVAGGDDSIMVVIDLQGESASPSVAKIPVPNSILDISYNSTGEMVALSLSNGDVQIYSVINESPNLLETIKDCIKEKINTSMDEIDFVNEHKSEYFSTKTQWTPNGEHLLIPSDSKTKINVYNRSNWKEPEFSIGEQPDGVSSQLVDFSLSPNGKYLALVDKESRVTIFDFKAISQIKSVNLTNTDTATSKLPLNLSWSNAKGGSIFDLFVGTTNGDIITLSEVVSKSNSSTRTENLFLDEAEEASDEDDDEEGSKLGGARNGLSVEDNDDLDGLFNNSDTETASLGRRHLHQEDSMLIDEDEEIDSEYGSRKKRSYRSLNGHSSRSSPKPSSSTSIVAHSQLKPFSPGSTSWNADKSTITSRRYLSMNAIGYVWAVKSDDSTQQQSITVSFFDRAVNKDYHFTDYSSFDLCSVNSRGLLLASSGYETQQRSTDSAGKLFYRHHDSLQDSWDHQIPLLKGEFITSITLSNKSTSDEIIVVGTNFGYVRFFNLYGVCIYLMKSSPVLSLISSGPIVFIVNEIGNGTSYTYSILNINEDYKFLQQDVILPLIKRGHEGLIKGIFFNENNDPCIVGGHDDTLIILSNWRQSNNCKWIPILNLDDAITEGGQNESKRNWNSWPLGLYKDEVSLLILKSGNKYPGFPLPLPVEVSIKLPVKHKKQKKSESNSNSENAIEEDDPSESFIRALTMGRIVHESLQSKEEEDEEDEDNDELVERLENYSLLFDKSLLKIFAQACQDAQLSRAFSVAKLIKTDKALFAASKIAERMEFLSLATRIGKLREDLLE